MTNKPLRNARDVKHDLKVEYVSTSLLKSAIYNPRKWSDSAISQLTESIKRFGLIDPIIVNGAENRKNIVIGGHFRLKIAKDLGYEEVPVVYLDIPNIDKEKELNIRLNKNVGDWDTEKLKSFDLDLLINIGFDTVDLSALWKDELETKDDDFDVEKELAQIKKPNTRIGDLIILGNHRLICGDSTDLETIKKLCGNDKVDMIYSDPVYNLRVNYDKGIGGTQNYGGNVNDNRSDSEYKDFLRKSLTNALSVSNKDIHVFYWNDQSQIGLVQELYREQGIDNKRVCLWIKNSANPTPGVAFSKCYEPAIYGTKGRPYITKGINDLNEVMNKEAATGNDLLDQIDVWLVKRLPSNQYEHSTSKPPTLHEKAVRRCTKVGDIILDSFLGSGSTLIAGEMLKRRVFGSEKEPVFCDLIIRRFEKLTNIKAKIIRHEEK